MSLYCGATKEEVVAYHPGMFKFVDLLLYGGSADHQCNVFLKETWEMLLNTYGRKSFKRIFIDGGLHGGFQTFADKCRVVEIIQTMCSGHIYVYGNHMLADGQGAYSKIPVERYTIENMREAYDRSPKQSPLARLALDMHYNLLF